jgi:hypothetical protein
MGYWLAIPCAISVLDHRESVIGMTSRDSRETMDDEKTQRNPRSSVADAAALDRSWSPPRVRRRKSGHTKDVSGHQSAAIVADRDATFPSEQVHRHAVQHHVHRHGVQQHAHRHGVQHHVQLAGVAQEHTVAARSVATAAAAAATSCEISGAKCIRSRPSSSCGSSNARSKEADDHGMVEVEQWLARHKTEQHAYEQARDQRKAKEDLVRQKAYEKTRVRRLVQEQEQATSSSQRRSLLQPKAPLPIPHRDCIPRSSNSQVNPWPWTTADHPGDAEAEDATVQWDDLFAL